MLIEYVVPIHHGPYVGTVGRRAPTFHAQGRNDLEFVETTGRPRGLRMPVSREKRFLSLRLANEITTRP
jgi:hypothetical protein